MIAFFSLDLKRIAEGSRDYCWPRPSCCDRCKHPKVWGHGFVLIIFIGFAEALSMRRYRCPSCGGIIRLRPLGYFKGHQSTTASIREALATRIKSGHWPEGCTPSRARNWLRALKRHTIAVFGLPAMANLIIAFDQLVNLGRVPVSRTL